MAALNFPSSPSDGDTYTPSGSTITYTYSSSKGSWQGQLSGSAATVVSLTGSTNNQVTTVTGANAITGESNLTFDGSTLTVTGNITVPNDGDIGSVGATDAIQISSGGIVTFKDDILIKDSGTIGSASDPDAITIAADGTVTFSSNLTVTGTTTLNGNLVLGDAAADTLTVGATIQGASPLTFEGGTADGFETTFAITDPTADRTITFPNATGTVAFTSSDITGNAATVTSAANNSANETVYLTFVDGQTGAQEIETDVGLTYNPSTGLITSTSVTAGTLTSTGNIVVSNGGDIGSASDTDAISISSGGVVTLSATTGSSSKTSGALVVGGGIGANGNIWLSGELNLDADSSLIAFGDDQDVVLQHVADTGLVLNGSRQLQFGDNGTYIHQSSDGVLDLVSDSEIEINATTVDLNGNLDVSGTYTGAGLMTTGGNIVIPNDGRIGTVSDTDAISIAGYGDVTFSQQIYTSNGTLGAPAIAFSADTDTGIYQAAGTGYIEFGIDGTKEFDIRSNGITVKDGGKIGSNGDSDAISIAGDGKVTFSQQLLFESGSTGTPGLAFSADTDTGIYQSGSGLIEFSINGTKEFTINSTGIKGPNDYQIGSEGQQNAMAINSSGAVTFPSAQATFTMGLSSVTQATFMDGSAGTPSISNIGDTDTGMYFSSDNEIGFSTSGSDRLKINSSGVIIPDDTYIGSVGDYDAIRIAGNGVVTFSQHASFTTGLTSVTQLKIYDGDAGTPGIAFSNDTDTGWYSATNGEQNWSLDGTMKMHLDSTGLDVEGTILCTPTATLTIADSGGTVQKTIHGVGST